MTTISQPRSGSALLAQVKAELLRALRVPEYLIGVVFVPVVLFAMFGLPNVDDTLSGGTNVAAVTYATMAAYGVVSLAIFTFGADVAEERGRPWTRRMRVTPMPMWVYFAGKFAKGLLLSGAILVIMYAVAALGGGVPFDARRLVATWVVLLAGTLAFSPFGYAIAYWFQPKAAGAVANLIFLPLAFFSCFFMAMDGLPDFVGSVAPWLPTYHFGQLVMTVMTDSPQEMQEYGTPLTASTWVHLTWVAGSFVVFAALTVWGYRRDRERVRG